MTVVVAGVDVGNHTTEIVLARVTGNAVEQIAHGQGPTRGRKGSRESLDGAAALLRKLEVEAGVAADELLLAALRPVDTATAPLPPPSSPSSPVRSLRAVDASTPAGTGFGVGRHRPAEQPSRRGNRRCGNRFRRLVDRLRGGGPGDLGGSGTRLGRRRGDRRAGRRRPDPQSNLARRARRRRGGTRRRRARRLDRGGGRCRGPRLPRDGRSDRPVRRPRTGPPRHCRTSPSSPESWRTPRPLR